VDDLLEVVRKAFAANIPPWTGWPEPPCGSAKAYFQLCTGVSYDQLLVLFDTFGVAGDLRRAG
jgi:hypothetical protein